MKGIKVYTEENKSPQLIWEDVPDVSYTADEVLVDIKATAVNRADLMQAEGRYPPPHGASEILGLEMAGVIREIGGNVKGWKVGDRVCALLSGGGYAEQTAVQADMLLPLPQNWRAEMAAAVPEVWLTAFVNLFIEGQLHAGQTALIHAGGSGVGTAAVQLVRAIGATPYVTAGSEAKLQKCRELGAALAINYKTQNFEQEVLTATDGHGVNLVLDPVGAAYLDKNMKVLGWRGRLVHIGLLSGHKSDINLGLLMGKRLHLIGSTLRSRPLEEKIKITRQFKEKFWSQLESGALSPIIDTTFPIQEAQAAHAHVRQNLNIGKVILTI